MPDDPRFLRQEITGGDQFVVGRHQEGAQFVNPLLAARAGEPGSPGPDLHHEKRLRGGDLALHLLAHARGERLVLGQWVGVNKPGCGTAPGVKVDLRLGAKHGDAIIDGGMRADVIRERDGFGERLKAIK